MPRPRRFRRIHKWPVSTYFRPGRSAYSDVVLTLDEFEAMRLKDLEGLTQEEAAKRMGISQPTFNRLLLSARKKVSQAITEGRGIRIEGGDVVIGRGPPEYCVCPVCGHKQIKVRGLPCSRMICEKCGSRMVREGFKK